LLPDSLGVYESSKDIDFGVLPASFVLKCSHGCSFNIICKDKNELDPADTRRRLDTWLMVDYSVIAGELHYSGIKPRIICEPFLGAPDGSLPLDYKVYCFDGRAYCTMVCTDRDINGQNAAYYFYDREWNSRMPFEKMSQLYEREIPKPEIYDKIIDAADKLSKPFPFVRVDFYFIQGRAVFGEMTFTPKGCIDTDFTDMEQHALGQLIRLPEKRL
jgi:TupA-like ATPgrasp